MDAYGIFAILLLVVGIAILAAEVFIPSGGLLFLTTMLLLGASVWCAYLAWWRSAPDAFWAFCAFLLMLVPAALVGAFTLFPRTKFGKRILLDAPDPEQITPYAKETARLEQLIGTRGVTQTLLNPGGMVLIDGERYHAFTDGLLLEAGTPVDVAEVRGTRLLVRTPSHDSSAADDDEENHEPDPLDFDIPKS